MQVVILKGYTEHEGFEIEAVFDCIDGAQEYMIEQAEDLGVGYPNRETLGYDWVELEEREVM